MKEKLIREMIKKQIKSSLKEAPDMARSAVGASLGRVEKMAGVKMLKKALGQGTPQQQAAGLLKVVQSISGNNPATAKALARMLVKGGIDTEEPVAEEPARERSSPTPVCTASVNQRTTIQGRINTIQQFGIFAFLSCLSSWP